MGGADRKTFRACVADFPGTVHVAVCATDPRERRERDAARCALRQIGALPWSAMDRASPCWGLVVSVGFATLVGCAVGVDPNAVTDSELMNLPMEAGGENSIVLPPPSNPQADAGAPTDPGSGAPDAGKSPGPNPDPGTGTTCASPNTCPAATDLGSVSGDTGADTRTFQGSGSQWLTVRVAENDGSLFGVELQVRVDLQSPPGTNFDLFVYRAGGEAGQECSAVTTSSASTGGFDTASMHWGETSFANGSNDDRTVTLEVRHVSGTCAAAAKWTLNVYGDTL